MLFPFLFNVIEGFVECHNVAIGSVRIDTHRIKIMRNPDSAEKKKPKYRVTV